MALLGFVAEGRIDEGKARMLLEQLSVLSAVHAAIAEPVLIEHASRNNHSATRQYAVRYVHRLDPKAAERHHQEKHKPAWSRRSLSTTACVCCGC